MAVDMAGNSVLTVECTTALSAGCREVRESQLDRRLLKAVIASLVVHSLLLLPSTQPSIKWDGRSWETVTALTDSRLEVFLRGAVENKQTPEPQVDHGADFTGPLAAAGKDEKETEIPVAIPLVYPLAARQTEYVSANDLDVHPSPQAPIVVPFPDAFEGSIKGQVVLVLSVAVDGIVEQVVVDDSDLPVAFGEMARQTFMKAHLRPGIKDGRPVAVRMKIMVEFES